MSGLRRRRLPGLTVNRLIPNAVTLLALCAGLTAIRLAFLERWELAIAAVLVAMVGDVLDGRIARLMNATSEFGAQLDSLADVISFGVTPAIIVYLWALGDAGGLGWALVLVFVMARAWCIVAGVPTASITTLAPSPPAACRTSSIGSLSRALMIMSAPNCSARSSFHLLRPTAITG